MDQTSNMWQGGPLGLPALTCLIIASVCFVLVMIFEEIDTVPTPRTLNALGCTYYDAGRVEEAQEVWAMGANYNEVFNRDYSINSWPQGVNIQMCLSNLAESSGIVPERALGSGPPELFFRNLESFTKEGN